MVSPKPSLIIFFIFGFKKNEIEAVAKSIYEKIDEADGFRDSIEETLQMQVAMEENQKIGCSIGITTCEEFVSVHELDDMIKVADDSLYSVKAAGKGTYIFA